MGKPAASRKRSDAHRALKAELRREIARAEKMADEVAGLKAEWQRRVEQLDRAGLIHEVTEPLVRISVN